MKKYFIISMFAVFGIAAVADACPQAIRRERVRVVQPRQRVVERQVVRERVIAPVQRVERVIVEKQVDAGCLDGHCQQNFRRVERVRSSY
jgi:hypothetical protein